MGDNFPLFERLGKLASVQGGFAFKSRDFTDSGVPVLKIKNVGNREVYTSDLQYVTQEVSKNASRFFCKTGDILISMTGSGPQAPNSIVGRVARFTGPSDKFLINQRVGRFVIKEPSKLEKRFLFYVLTQMEIQWFLVSIATGSANQVNISSGQVEDLQIPLPPLSVQKAIAHILGTLDDKIKLNRRMNETLEAMAKAIFKSWFVDFDPVRAKAEGRQPEGMDADTAALFPEAFEDSPLGKIPMGWSTATIGEMIDVVGGTTPSTRVPKYWNGNINFATPKDMSSLSSPILMDTERRITEDGLLKIGSRLLPKGSVLLSSRAPIGYLAITLLPVAVNQGIIAMICNKQLPNYYILNLIQYIMDVIITKAGGTTFLEISKTNFRPIEIVVPTRKVMEKFLSFVQPTYQRMIANLTESRTLAAIRDALLPRLISGEVRVKDAEKIAAGAGLNP